MAAVALLRSVASKMARAPPMHHRPLLARGLHAGARSEAGASGYTRPPASNEQAGLRSVLTMLARAPPPPCRRLLHARGHHSRTSPPGSTQPQSSNKDPSTHSSESLRGTITLAKARAGVAYITLVGSLIYMCGWLKPGVERLVDKVNTLSIERLIIEYNIQAIELECQHLNVIVEDVLNNVCEAPSMLSSGHGKEPVGATQKGTRVDKLEEEVAKVHCLENRVKELQSGIKDLQAKISKVKIALERKV